MRTILAAVALTFITGSAFAEDLPTKDCPVTFMTKWQSDSASALKDAPRKPCWMRTGSGPYVCYKDGCVRASAYFEGG
ncbi:hypothetical protein [Methylobacterium mesophilicum]